MARRQLAGWASGAGWFATSGHSSFCLLPSLLVVRVYSSRRACGVGGGQRVPGRVRTTYLYCSRSSPRLRRFKCSTARLETSASDLFSAPSASPSRRKPVREPNRCNLEPFKPETPRIALYLVVGQGRLTPQVVYLGLLHFRLPVRLPKSPSRPTRENPGRPWGGLGGGSCQTPRWRFTPPAH
jgi:hypothetical protein